MGRHLLVLGLRIAAIFVGLFFLLPGMVGTFRPERLAEILALAPETEVGSVAIRTLIGAPYLAMGVATLYAAIRKQWAWLVPIAMIEGAMLIVRVMSGFTYGFETAGVREMVMETVVVTVLAMAAILPPRSRN